MINAAAYTAKIKAMDAPLRKRLSAIPEDKRWLITSEGAFSYLARDYAGLLRWIPISFGLIDTVTAGTESDSSLP